MEPFDSVLGKKTVLSAGYTRGLLILNGWDA